MKVGFMFLYVLLICFLSLVICVVVMFFRMSISCWGLSLVFLGCIGGGVLLKWFIVLMILLMVVLVVLLSIDGLLLKGESCWRKMRWVRLVGREVGDCDELGRR